MRVGGVGVGGGTDTLSGVCTGTESAVSGTEVAISSGSTTVGEQGSKYGF